MSQCQGTHEQRRVCLQQQIRHPGLRSSELHRCRSRSMERLAHVWTHLQLPDVATVTCRTQHSGTPKERCPQCCPSSGHRSLSTREPCPLPSPAGGAQCPQAMTLGPAGGREAVGQGRLDCWCRRPVVHGATGHEAEREWVYFSSRSDLNCVRF